MINPYFKDDDVTIYHGDCFQIAPLLGQFDLLLTDPPYGLGDKLQGGTWASDSMYLKMRKWDVRPDDDRLLALTQKANNAIVWGGNYFTLPPTRGFLLWLKGSHMRTMADAEYAWTTLDCPAKSFVSTRNPDGRREHPTQKPVDLFRWCIEQVDDVETILDPFAGSGTTGRAAKDLGRKAVLIESDEEYCEIAVRKLSQHVLPLF